MLTRGIVNKIAHGPISQLRKHAGADNGTAVLEAIRNISGWRIRSCLSSDLADRSLRCGRRTTSRIDWKRSATNAASRSSPQPATASRAARLKEIGNKGLFTKEIEEALLDGRIDLAVHSLKDMPTELPAGLQITATPEREDARDVMVGRKLADLPAGSRVGTGSLAAHRPDPGRAAGPRGGRHSRQCRYAAAQAR